MVEDIDIEFLALKHGVADGHIDAGVIPRVEGIDERTCAEQRHEKHGKEEQF